jgi:endonuclease/exonuclease/phosphatase (EEP) superfamily protein YafD
VSFVESRTSAAARPAGRARRVPWALGISVAYLVVVAAIVLGTERLGDAEGHWFFTALLFAPRWPLALPLVVLVPCAALGRHKLFSLGALAAVVALLAWFNDIGVSLRGESAAPRAERLRVMTYNIGGGSFEPADLVALVKEVDADVVGLEECQLDEATFAGTGYSQRNDNGNCLVTRLPIKTIDVRDPQDIWDKNGSGAIARYELEWAGSSVDVEVVHLETVREGLETLPYGFWKSDWQGPKQLDDNVAERALESRLAADWSHRGTAPVIVVGDFNMPQESAIFRAYWSGLHNALSERTLGRRVTKATRWHGIRIDHVLFDDRLTCLGARVTRHLGMDHRPVVADFRLAR